jgi:choline dehydrogenase-like flavoprotein
LELAAADVAVVLLESGGPDIEEAPQALNDGESDGETYHPLDDRGIRVRAFGGTSRHWVDNGPFRARPLDPIDFEARAGIEYSGWPIDRTDLDPYYERAQPYCHLGPFDYQPQTWHTRHLPDFPERTLDLAPFQLNEVDWSSWRQRITSESQIDAILHATAVELQTTRTPERVNRLVVRRADGSKFYVEADQVVLAAHTVENTRLMLNGNPSHPRGIANGHDVLGRFFQDHLAVQAGVIRPRGPVDADHWKAFQSVQTHVPGVRVKSMLTLHDDRVREEEILNAAFFVYPSSAAQTSTVAQSARSIARLRHWRPVPPTISRDFLNLALHPGTTGRLINETLTHRSNFDRYQLLAMTEQAPNPDSRITLGSERDVYSSPLPKLTWSLTDLDHRSIRRSVDVIDHTLRDLGWGTLEAKYGDNSPQGPVWGSYHQLGSTRMSTTDRLGVVDPDLRVHGMANLHIVGGSVFPSGGYANPTLTIVAMAIRLADRLASELRPHAGSAEPVGQPTDAG